MKAQELRVGNYLERYGKRVKIVEIGIKHKNDTNYYLRCEGDNNGYWMDQFKPIPLTEEVLLKCGFILFGQGYIHETMRYNDLFKIREDGYIVYVVKDNYITKLKHLHELQNLYYALTNQELNINL